MKPTTKIVSQVIVKKDGFPYSVLVENEHGEYAVFEYAHGIDRDSIYKLRDWIREGGLDDD